MSYPSFEELSQWRTYLDHPDRKAAWLDNEERRLVIQWFHDHYIKDNPGFRHSGETFDLFYGKLPYDFTMVHSDKPNVIFFSFDQKGVSDYGTWIKDFDPYGLTDYICEYVNNRPAQNFYLFTPLIEYARMFRKIPDNLHISNWTQSIFFDRYSDWRDVIPITHKDHTSSKHFVCLNGMPRWHRTLCVMYLLGQDADRFGHISLNPSDLDQHGSWEQFKDWWSYNNSDLDISMLDQLDNVFPKGFQRIKDQQGYNVRGWKDWVTDPKHRKLPYDVINNFETNLKKQFYNHTVIEIVNETLYFQHSGIVSEKYINTVYGKNLPIILSCPRTVKTLRGLGFDMYDDVVDHSYDLIDHPLERLITALENNIKLLIDPQHARSAWQQCQSRMQHNIDLAQTLMYQNQSRLNDIIKTFE